MHHGSFHVVFLFANSITLTLTFHRCGKVFVSVQHLAACSGMHQCHSMLGWL